MLKRHPFDFLVPALVIVFFAVLGVTGLEDRLDSRVYDLFLRVRPAIPEDHALLLVDIDDAAISQVGEWPWSRDVMANGLILMKEMGAASAVFDIEYINASPHGLDTQALTSTLPDAFSQEFSQIQNYQQNLVDAIAAGRISPRDVESYGPQLSTLDDQSRQRLLDAVQGVERDNDAFLGKAARFFGKTTVTVHWNNQPDKSTPKDLMDYALANLSVKNIDVRTRKPPVAVSITPTILAVAKGAASAGFPNVVPDPDGVRRRVDLIKEYEGKYFAQLSFGGLLPWLGNPGVVLNRRSIVLHQANIPGKGRKDIVIPLTPQGAFLVNWPHEEYLKSFRHLSFYELYVEYQLENDLLYRLKLMDQVGYLQYDRQQPSVLKRYDAAERIKNQVLDGGSRDQIPQYVKARAAFFDAAGNFLNGGAQDHILSEIDKVLGQKGLTADQRDGVEQTRAEVVNTFEENRKVYQDVTKIRADLSNALRDSFCIVGVSATSTTDLGVTPFANVYANMGLHAAVANTIIQGQFLREVPWWYGLIIAIFIALGATLAILGLTPARSVVVGAAIVLGVAAIMLFIFRQTGVYLEAVSPVGAAFLTFIGLTAIKFLRSEQEKGEVRSAFSRYVSPHVVSDLLANPEKLKLGGEKKEMTAIFSDVKGFSSISEALDPTDLVRLLNEYLTVMSDIILALGGTVDKYEGDAIIAFFGAPLDLPEHAERACMAAVKMHRAEKILNERVLAENLSKAPLLTRIGMNTGSMVVGNMGTPQKMNYTMMGNAVNLASRLEGVNKVYGTWVMMSEATYDKGGKDFFVRKLDRVRVVGIEKPVRLYELIDEKDAVDRTVAQAVEVFHEGLADFEDQKWKLAAATFRRVLTILPTDATSEYYLKRCQLYMRKPPVNWDKGIFKLESK